MRIVVIASLVLLLAACSTTDSYTQQRGSYGSTVQQQSIATDQAQVGQSVHWGGKIIQVNNFQTYSQIQLVQFPLNHYGRPVESADSDGRFYVRSDAFLDPEIFTVGSFLTVNGEVVEMTALNVDQRQLTLPVVELQDSQRWPINRASGRPYNPKHDWPFIGYGYYGTGSYSP